METTKQKFKLYRGPVKEGDCKFSMGFLKIFLDRIALGPVTYSTAGFAIGNNNFQFSDLVSFDFAQVIVSTQLGACAYGTIRIAIKNGKEFVLFPEETWGGGIQNVPKINKRIVELFQRLNELWKPLKREKYSPVIKRTILDLGTRFTRLQVAEIAESCGVADEALIIATVQDMITKHQIDAQYFAITKAVAFNQQANLAARDAFIAELEAEFANWRDSAKIIKKT